MISRRVLAGAVAATLALLGACSSDTTTATPTTAAPSASEALSKSAAAMASVSSAKFALTVAGELPAVTVQAAQGALTDQGDARGTATIVQFGQLVEVEFVLVGGDLYLKGATGGFTRVPAALAGAVYDPSAILDPTKGVAKVLSSVTNPALTGTDGDAWLISGSVPAAVAAGLVPGIGTDVTGMFTIEMATFELTAADLTLDGSDGKPATVKVELSELNEPVSISPPG